MTRDDIIRMAREAGLEVHDRKEQVRVGMDALLGIDSTAKVERFAVLVAAAEREACAKVCETYETASIRHESPSTAMIFNHCAKAIRARGEMK